MKNFTRIKGMLLLAAVLLFCGATVFAADKEKEKAAIKFEEKLYDFGVIDEKGGPKSHEFVYTNDGEGNLVIYEAKAECGCTTATFSEAPVAPGKTGKIKVIYNPMGRPGAFTKTVTVKTNGNPEKVYLKIRGTVKP